jgi:acyl-CoA synthetase (AMP-forming)/AMP-acid ligase II
MASTPSLLNHLPRPGQGEGNTMYAKMHTVLLGGETPTPDLLESWTDAGVRVFTAYGATETTSMGCIREVERDRQSGTISAALIGKPMALSQVWLLGEDGGIVEDDLVEGEIIIAGEGVAQGYYKDEAKTIDAFTWWNGRRVYRTGDYGRWVREGGGAQGRVVEFRGRKDRTVKNRGFLVNLDRDVEDGLFHAGASLGVKSVRAALTENGIVAVVSPSCVDTAELLVQAGRRMSAYCLPYRM